MGAFQYEWWTVEIQYATGRYTCEYKGRNRENVIRQIERDVKRTNSSENLSKPWFQMEQPIKQVYWETMKLDRVGYQRRF